MRTQKEKDEWREKKLKYLEKYRVRPENKARHLLAAKKYREANRDKVNAYARLWKKKNYAELKLLRAKRRSDRAYTFDDALDASRKRNRADRLKVLSHYSDGIPSCKCCGESLIEFLAIDHVNGDGAQHRRIVKNIVSWLIKNNFPEGFQILCHNCNIAKGYNRVCPHTVLKPVQN